MDLYILKLPFFIMWIIHILLFSDCFLVYGVLHFYNPEYIILEKPYCSLGINYVRQSNYSPYLKMNCLIIIHMLLFL